ncbi:hypothetical protein ZWY2020_048040 [Hordeum vulgare]|nr:hypothetical protein ZWY2020_048040 [Hordeum vulgare]
MLVHQAQEPPPPPPSSPCYRPDTTRAVGPQIRLGDNRAPVISTTRTVIVPLMASPPIALHTNGEHQKPPKHDFPQFDGSTPYLWIDRCIAYFDLYWVAPHNWVATTEVYIDGQVAHWMHAFRQTHRDITWEAFTASLLEEFGADEYELVLHKLLQLLQTGTVSDYGVAFDEHMYHLLALDPSINTKFFVTQFLLWSNDELCTVVRLHAPSSITQASALAHM